MHYFQEQLLNYSKTDQFLFLLNEPTIRSSNYMCPIENSHNSVDQMINQFTVKMPVHPELTPKQQDLSFYIHTQEKKQAIIFEIEEIKRKPLKKKIPSKNVNQNKEGIKQCQCCEAKFMLKHKCDHTICQKPCARLKKSNKIRKAKQMRIKYSQGHFNESKEESIAKDSEYQNQDEESEESLDQYRMQSESFSSFSDPHAKKLFVQHFQKKKKNRRSRKIFKTPEKQDEQKDEENLQAQIKSRNSQIKNEQVKKQQNNNHNVELKNKEENMNLQLTPGEQLSNVANPPGSIKDHKKVQKVKRRRGKRSEKKIVQDHASSNQFQSQFVPGETMRKKICRARGRKNTEKSSRKYQQEDLQLEQKKGRKSISNLDADGSSNQSIESYRSPPKTQKSLSHYCTIENLTHDKIFQIKFDNTEMQEEKSLQKKERYNKMEEQQNSKSNKKNKQNHELSQIEEEGMNNENSYLQNNNKANKSQLDLQPHKSADILNSKGKGLEKTMNLDDKKEVACENSEINIRPMINDN